MSTLNDMLNAPIEGGLPVQEFTGVLKDMNVVTGEDNRQRLEWDFTDCDIIQTREPYNFPTVKLIVNYNTKKNTAWDAFKTSLDKIIQGPVNADELKGKKFHCKRLPFQIRGPVFDATGEKVMDPKRPDRQLWDLQLMEMWHVVSIEGYATPEAQGNQFKELAELADGKNEKEFYDSIMADPQLKSNNELINAIIGRSLIPTMVSLGVIKVEGDKIGKV